jgi:sugar/nucleoside kinase (ribokinase family)
VETYDVYAYGVISSSTLHILSQPFPPADGYAEVARTYAMTGGEALNSAIVLSRLGVRVMLDGNWIGDNPQGRRLLETIQGCGIDAPRLKAKKGYQGVLEIVFSDDSSRTIFGTYQDLQNTTRKWNIPRKTDLARARIACVDPPFGAESALVGSYALELGVPFVSIDCPYEQELSSAAEAVIISGEFRGRQYLGADLAELFAAYQARAKGLVVFTRGGEDIWYSRRGAEVRRVRPYPVRVIDSAGAGDSFRAGVVYGLLQG